MTVMVIIIIQWYIYGWLFEKKASATHAHSHMYEHVKYYCHDYGLAEKGREKQKEKYAGSS